MIAPRGHRAVSSWVLPVLVLLLAFGHACEVPAYAGLVVSLQSGEAPDHPGHGHDAGEPEISCDPIGAVSSPGHPHLVGEMEIPVAFQIGDSAPARRTGDSLEHSVTRAARPPLFLLHASLLI